MKDRRREKRRHVSVGRKWAVDLVGSHGAVYLLKSDRGQIIQLLAALEDDDALCAYDIGTRLGYRFGKRTVTAQRWLECLEADNVVESFRDKSRNKWLQIWRLKEVFR